MSLIHRRAVLCGAAGAGLVLASPAILRAQAPQRRVYVAAGQSNRVGVNTGAPPTYANAARIWRYSQPWHAGWGIPCSASPQTAGAGTWALAGDPLHSDPQCNVGPTMQAMDTLLTLHGDPTLEVGIVPCAWGGSDIRGLWGNQYLYWSAFGMMLARIHAAKAWGKISGFLWYQGEAEALSAYPSWYQTEFFRLLLTVRFLTGEPNLPATIVKLGPCPDPAQYPGWAKMQAYIAQMEGVDPRLAVVDASDLNLRGDGSAHLSVASAVTLGYREGQALAAMGMP